MLLQNEVEFKRKKAEVLLLQRMGDESYEAEIKRDKYGERVGIMLDSQWYTNPEFRLAFLKTVNSQKYKNMRF